MKSKLACAAAVLIALSSSLPAASPGDPHTDLTTLVAKVNAKIEHGNNTETALEPELKEYDALLAKYKDDKSAGVAEILVAKAMLYVQVLDNSGKAISLLTQLKQEFPDTPQGKRADEIIDSLKAREEAKKAQAALTDGTAFPQFEAKDLGGKLVSLSDYKGKVVLVDFWATWCPPCVGELPNVIETYSKYHKNGFEVIGISLDQEKAKLTSFIKEKAMPWPQLCDGKGWQSALAAKYGVHAIPATFLLDRDGRIIAKSLRGEALEEAVAKALAKK